MQGRSEARSDRLEDRPIARMRGWLPAFIGSLRVTEKVYTVAGLLSLVTGLFLVMSFQSVQLQRDYRHDVLEATEAALDIQRVNGLVYASVMESRGIYMSTDRNMVEQFAKGVLARNVDLAEVVAAWQARVRNDDASEFALFKEEVGYFIDFRDELARRAINVSRASAQEWGNDEEERKLREDLNMHLAALSDLYIERSRRVAELGDSSRHASWFLMVLGLAAVLLAALNVLVVQRLIIKPMADITEASRRIAAGKTELDIPHISRNDEIGAMAYAVEDFRKTANRNIELEQIKLDTVQERDDALGERDKLHGKYSTKKGQLSAAIDGVVQGVMMIDAAGTVLVVNDQYRKMLGLPVEIQAGCSLADVLVFANKSGLFVNSPVASFQANMARIATREPRLREIELADGRLVSVSEQPMADGGWIVTLCDMTDRRRLKRIIERTERFMVSVIEAIPEAILVKDARTLRYVLVNRAAERLLGLPRSAIMGKTARLLFPAAAADLVAAQDEMLVKGNPEIGTGVTTLETPNHGRRLVTIRRIPVGKPGEIPRLLVSLIEDHTLLVDEATAMPGPPV